MSGFHDNALIGASGSQGYQISRSVRLRASASAYFNRTPASAGNRKTWTWSGWVKLGSLSTTLNLMYAYSADSDSGLCQLSFQSNQLRIQGFSASFLMVSTPVYRDPSAWYHIVYKVDTTQATAANRVRVYVNGVEITAWATNTPPPQNTDTAVNNNVAHNIGRNTRNSNDYLDGYLTEINLIDGQALDPSYFGETNAVTGVWQPKKYAGTYGTNGFYLNFSDNSAATAAAIGKDYSGNGNNWTPNNISVTAGVTYDSMLDVPTQWADGGNGRGNYATWSPIDHPTTFIAPTNGNLSQNCNTAAWTLCVPTFAIPDGSGLWQWELIQTGTANGANAIGVCLTTVQASVTGAPSSRAGCSGVDNVGTTFINGATSGSITYPTVGNTITCLYDATNRTFQVFDNGTSKGTITGLPAGDVRPFVAASSSNGSPTFVANFGQTTFAYNKGGKALNTLNLPTPTILKGNQYFDAVAYAGSASQQTITTSLTGLDFAWIKNRSAARSHVLVDRVRGGSPLLTLYSDLTAAEDNTSANYNPTSFTDSGIVLGGAKLGINNAGENFVLWGWKEGATQGFDIVTYTGDGTSARAISHSLGVAPKMIIIKQRNAGTYGWVTYHASVGAGSYLTLNGAGAAAADTAMFNNTAPTSSVFTLSSGGNIVVTNPNTGTMVAYLFSEVAGFSKFGSYTGNGSADGPFVFCGFRPRFVLTKRTDSTGDWQLMDTSRDNYNVASRALFPNLSLAEATGYSRDILSNGFKLRDSGASLNASGGTYIFAAFAENPFKNALAR